jgi:hypothetical protein
MRFLRRRLPPSVLLLMAATPTYLRITKARLGAGEPSRPSRPCGHPGRFTEKSLRASRSRSRDGIVVATSDGRPGAGQRH